MKITKRITGEGTSDKHSSQCKYYQQLSFLTGVFTPDADNIVVDVNEDMCDY